MASIASAPVLILLCDRRDVVEELGEDSDGESDGCE
jgi:hypothetical protein